jgi:hypothetical protein
LPLPSPLLLLSPITPIEPISIDKVNKDKDKNTKEPIEVEDKDIGSLLLLPPIRFISV